MKKTPLNKVHHQLSARMVDFAGWEMPVYYARTGKAGSSLEPGEIPLSPDGPHLKSGIFSEHMAVRTKCGIFDVSHMGEIEIQGPEAEAIAQRVTCNDVTKLKPGDCQYSAFLTERGTFVDDIIVNRRAPDRFLICVNASNTEKDFQWIKQFGKPDTKIENRSEDYFQIALQGPEAERILICDTPLPAKPFTFIQTKISGRSVLIARTGYTGEDGFEIYGNPKDAENIWALLMEKGATPCGLGARDTLRLEAAYPLYGHEIDDTTNPYEARLDWIVKLDKGDFVGREALLKIPPRPPLSKGGWGDLKQLIGIEMCEPGIARQGCKIYAGPDEIGFVTSGTKAPFLDKAVALGYVKPAFASKGGKIGIDIHHKKRHAVIVSLPFYKRSNHK